MESYFTAIARGHGVRLFAYWCALFYFRNPLQETSKRLLHTPLPVTNETYATGSLSEVGFSILQAIRLDDRRDFVVLIQQDLSPELNNPIARKESLRARALVMQHLRKLRLKNLYVVDTLEQMMEVSINLFEAAKLRAPLARYSPH